MSDEGNSFGFNLSDGSIKVIELKDSFYLCDSQLDIYRNEKFNNVGTLYNNPFKVKLDKFYSVKEIKEVIYELIGIFPILSAHIVENGDNLSFAFDADLDMIVGSFDDVGSFVFPFDLEKSLSRFLIVEDRDAIFLYLDLHQLIFDYSSLNIIVDTIFSLLDGDEIDYVDDGVLRQFSLEESILDLEYISNAKSFFGSFLCDLDDVSDLLPSVKCVKDVDFKYSFSFDLDSHYLYSFLEDNSISIDYFFASVFAYTLSRFTGSFKVLFNFMSDIRNLIGSLDSVGNLTYPLPLIFNCKNQSINSYLKYSSDLINSVNDYIFYPFCFLMEDYGLNSSIHFQFVSKFCDCVEDLAHDFGSDLSFYISYEDKVDIKVLYSNKYSFEFIERFVNVFKFVLFDMMELDELAYINYITSSDLGFLDSLNQSEKVLDYEDILDAFNDNLNKYSDNDLVLFNDNSYTYGEGAYIADRLAKSLVALGVEPQDMVAFLTERCEYYMFCVLGVLSVGGVYVPLDDKLPDERIKFMLEDTGCRVVIVSDDTYGRAVGLVDDDVVVLLNISDIVGGDIGCLDYLPVVYGELACILYTSGTTGVPKGVQITRKSLINMCENYIDQFDLDINDVYGLFASIGFDAASFIISVVMCAGACLAVVPEDIRLNMLKLNEYFISHNVSYVFITTQVGKLFVESVDETSLDVLHVGGEKLDEFISPDGYRLIDGYGPTESFTFISSIDNDEKLHPSSVGFIHCNLKIYVLDDELRRVPVGAVGELCIAGYQLAEGYLNRDEETNNAFIYNPFDDGDYGVMYRTGDMVRFLPDGSLGIVGRRDSQVKVRGNRVELSEVEAIIRELDFVDDVSVQTLKNGSNKELVAYVVSNREDNDIEADIKDYVLNNKPDYMIPSFIMLIDEVPLTVNGKVDKGALPEVDVGGLTVDYVAPKTNDEKLVVEAFEKVFNQGRIGLYDDFVHLGGDSLSAIRLLSYLEGYDLTAADIFSLRTPFEIAKNLSVFDFDLDIYSLEGGCPLNESQLNVYLDIFAYNKKDSYLVPLFIRIPDGYGVDDLVGALESMFSVHPILAMCVSDDFDVPYLVQSGSDPSVSIESDVSDDFVYEFLSRPFDLEDCLCRFLIVKNNPDHLLYCVFHHLIFDGFSVSVFERDLFSILEGKSIVVDDSFLKVAAFNSQIIKKDDFKDAVLFFESILVDVDDVGVLLESVCSDGPGIYSEDLDVDVGGFLDKVGVSENVLFTGVFAYTLSRFVGSDRVFFNIVDNGRDRFNNFDSVGMFVNTLPLVVDCKNRSVSSFMDYVADLVYGVLGYNFYPYRLLANDFDIHSDVLFQFMPDWFMEDDGLFVTDIFYGDFGNKIVKNSKDFITDLDVHVIGKGNEYILWVMYSDKYSREFVVEFVNVYKMILHDMISVDNLSDINYIDSSVLEFLDSINDTDYDLAFNDILDAFNENLVRDPNRKLVSFKDRSYTYGEGGFIADKIAKSLIDLGVRSQDRVAFLTERCEYYIFCSLGILSVGGVYVPLDDKHPDDRLQFIMEDTDAKVIIVSDETFDKVKFLTDRVVLNISDIIKGDVGCLEYLPIVYGDLACIIYTSGSTGVPKGVNITRRTLINMCEDYCLRYGFDASDVYGLFPSIGFDMSSFALNIVLCAGACLVVVPEDIRLDMLELNKYFISHNVSHAFITTQVGKLFMQSVDETSLEVLLVGGEKLGDFDSPVAYRLIDLYGPTESYIVTSIDNSEKLDYSSVGFPNFNVKIYVLDSELRRVPVGAVGELFIAGYQLADSYLNRDKENRDAFVDNPYDGREGFNILYRTGDLARFLPDGSLAFVARCDSQVKIRGNRVELSEVEAVIREIGYVEDVTVQTVRNGSNNELVAYVVINNCDDSVDDEIRSYVLMRKPDYMVPSFIMFLDNIPLNANGKVDRRALPDVDFDCLLVEYVPPKSKEEILVVDAFEKVLDLERVGLNDDFVRLGGDSLSAIKLLSYLEGYDVTAADIFSLSTPFEIAKSLNEFDFDLDGYSLEGGCPLSESQLNVYLDIFAYNKVGSYLIPIVIKVPPRYSVDELVDGIGSMFDVHPILGMCVSEDFDVPYLVRCGSKPSISIVSDVSDDFIYGFLSEPFDLYDCLCRFLIVDADDECILFGAFHHLIFDGLSSSVFKKDLFDILNGVDIDVDDSFLKVSSFNNQIINNDEFNDAALFYESLLVDVDDVGVLLDSVCADGPGYYNIDLGVDVGGFLDNLGVSENVLFTGVFAYTLSRFVGSDRVFFNIVDNGRDRFNNFDSVGMFVNTLPLVVDCKNRSVSSFMDDVADLLYGVLGYNFYPYRLLANDYDIHSDILFQYRPDWFIEEDVLDVGIFDKNIMDKVIDNDYEFISDLDISVVQKGNEYVLKVLYSDKFSRCFIEDFVNSYKLILYDMMNVVNLSEINYIGSSDLEFLDNINDTDYDLISNDILDTFNENLQKYPDNMLVSFWDKYYSYSECAFIADKLAKFLVDLGVNLQDRIAFLTERCEYYMFCVLGILSVGGVYLPLDDKLPDERIKFILEDTDCDIVIVSDETYDRVVGLVDDDAVLLNISDIVSGEVGCLSSLSVVYGDLACILYTSGSTGVPKGVKITRKSIINVCENYIAQYGLDESDVYGLFSSIGFDMSSFGICLVFCAGACLNVIPEDIRFNILKLNDYFIRHNVSHAFISTQVGKLFVEEVCETSLEVLIVAGERLGDFISPDDYQLVDAYGPTEALFICSINNFDKLDSSSVGFVNFNVKVYVLDDELRRVPFGAVGELYIAGYQLARGYLNRDEETSSAFIVNPFDDEEGYECIYKTGDMVRFLPDGSLGFVGRRDSQVKIRGNRVELGEVESVIRQMDFVDDVSVQTVKNGSNNLLVAYVVSSKEVDDCVEGEIKDYVLLDKPDYMVPSFIIFIDEIPLNVNGKVDRRALPEVDVDSLTVEYVAPTSEFEKIIVDAFEKIFDIEGVSIYDDFVKLGGDSLSAIKIKSLLDVDVDVKDILNFRTPFKIAQSIIKDKKYGFELVKEGSASQNMFLIPDIVGLSFVFSDLINSIDFDGNVYVIDDYKHDLSLDEIRDIEDNSVMLDYYYDAIKDLFQDGDIIVGYSLGCIYSSLLAERLEENKSVGECILIDGPLSFYNDDKNALIDYVNEFLDDGYSDDFREKLNEIILLNSVWNFKSPKINCHIIYFCVSGVLEDDLKKISNNYEFINITSTHKDIMSRDVGKISKYFSI